MGYCVGDYFRFHFFLAKILHQPRGLMNPATLVHSFGLRYITQSPQRSLPCGWFWYLIPLSALDFLIFAILQPLWYKVPDLRLDRLSHIPTSLLDGFNQRV